MRKGKDSPRPINVGTLYGVIGFPSIRNPEMPVKIIVWSDDDKPVILEECYLHEIFSNGQVPPVKTRGL